MSYITVYPKYLRKAVDIATENEYYPKWRLGAVIVKGGSVQSIGHSKLLSDPSQVDVEGVFPRPKVSCHAEVEALRRCGEPSGGILYVARIGRSGEIGMSSPCQACRQEIIEAGIKRVLFSINNSSFGFWYPGREE